VTSPDDELWSQLGQLFAARPGWGLEQSTTPGGAPSWCFGPGGEVELSVTVEHGTVLVYLTGSDRELPVGGVDGLRAWLDANEARYS
jgi:hypothetical protein